CQQVYKTPFTF
nr:immunoglobulin light chain junction region [Macaca mulatta]MOX25178.1 immunoglobulin light chain junction region [Macaca mulatta]MOX26065.1 immunoglobulin light chain junction region [Macaca mulatta]MOX26114.1 immunoglobulin light chain junction region [Macaca mulatta]MOX27140.1 immunoglobulin light chain junction region [Macaca mulatta]